MAFLADATAEIPAAECVLCAIANGADDDGAMVVFRGESSFVVLNIYPYTSGHVMVVPYRHTAKLGELEVESKTEMFSLAERAGDALSVEYGCEGLNLGMNLGRAAGAGIASHLHLHVVPRWVGDSNFMTSVANARVLPEALAQTRDRLRPYFTGS
jgi:ATP adenylyltransferase